MLGGAGPGLTGPRATGREPHAGAAAMGQVLGFAHCKEAPSTASTTPDSTEGGSEDPELPELPPPEEEEEEEEFEGGDTQWGPSPHEPTFSYIAFSGGRLGGGEGGPAPAPPPRRRDTPPRRGGRSHPLHPPPRLNSGHPPRGLDPPSIFRVVAPPPHTPQKRSQELSPPPQIWGGSLQEMGGGEETPRKMASTPLGPPPGSPSGPPSGPPLCQVPPLMPPPDQSLSSLGADGLVWELLYWRAPGRSALALVGTLGTLGCLARFSAISVGAYGALGILGITLPLRLHRAALRALRQLPPQAQPEPALGLSPEEQQRWARRLAQHLLAASHTLARLFLVHSLPESLKFAFFFYLLTYVGAACNGLTLLGAGVICAFTFPVLYQHHQAQIEQYLGLGRSHLRHLRARVLSKLPSAKAKLQ